MKYYLVNADHFDEEILDEDAYMWLLKLMTPNDRFTHTAIELKRPTEKQLNEALYYDPKEQAFLPYCNLGDV